MLWDAVLTTETEMQYEGSVRGTGRDWEIAVFPPVLECWDYCSIAH